MAAPAMSKSIGATQIRFLRYVKDGYGVNTVEYHPGQLIDLTPESSLFVYHGWAELA
jgi:hypothetical protein